MTSDDSQHIAVVGMACRLPGARDPQEFWRNLRDGVNSISFFTDQELVAANVPPSARNHPAYVKANGRLDDIELFDADFFGFSAREAEITDPQQRIFLECAWEAFEDAGYDPAAFDGSVGVYAGAGISTYLLRNLLSRPELVEAVDELQLLMANNKDFVPTRVSYALNLKGPSVNVNTACSTSLVAIHMACQSLLSFQCDMALAGGAGIQLPQDAGYRYHHSGILSPDGCCRAFDAAAQGTVSGNGVGTVVLKRMEDALEAGDCIRAVIRGSAINNDGSDKIGFTAPGISGQSAVIEEALALADVPLESIDYIETHGTGTPLGDPIEIAALQQVFRSRDPAQKCAIGSVKTNIGHVDEAAGVAGLIKTVLSLEHAQLPPSLHFRTPNPEIDFESGPFVVNARLKSLPADKTGRACVSSFGIGGTNAHVVMEQAPNVPPTAAWRPWQMFSVSARTSTALDAATSRLANHLRQLSDANPADIAFTLHTGRRAFEHRRTVVCRSLSDAVTALESAQQNRLPSVSTADAPCTGVVFLFPGQGAQYPDMARELYEQETVFRDCLDECSERLRPHVGFELPDVLYGAASPEERNARLQQTTVAQPALFAIEYSLAKLLMSWGLEPKALLGHSLGEFVAACLAEVISLPDALKLVAGRAQLMQQMPTGTMLAVTCSPDELKGMLPESLDLAVVNGPNQCVVSGNTESVNRLQTVLSERGVPCRPLQTSHAFHSRMMDAAVQPFRELVSGIELQPPRIPFVSNVTGTWITNEEAVSADYWSKHLRHTVQFAAGVDTLLKYDDTALLEVGPGCSLTRLVSRQSAERSVPRVIVNTTRHPLDQDSDLRVLCTAVAAVWDNGAVVDWQKYYAGEQRRRMPLPTYPFERKRYWVDVSSSNDDGSQPWTPTDRRSDVRNWFYEPYWKRVPLRRPLRRPVSGRWLVFATDDQLSAQLIGRLCEAGAAVSCVRVGTSFGRTGDDFVIDPARPEDYERLVAECMADADGVNAVLHLWTSAQQEARTDTVAIESAQVHGFYSLLNLARALSHSGLMRDLRIEVVSTCMQSVTGYESVCPEKATVLGPLRVIPLESPNITCRSIDLAPSSRDGQMDAVTCDQLLDLLSSSEGDPIVALRGASVFRQTLRPRPLDGLAQSMSRLRDGGTYLITGGLGSMGLAFARWLAQNVQARLVLTGRTPLPPESTWDDILKAHESSSRAEIDLSEQRQALAAVETEQHAARPVADLRAFESLEDRLHSLCSRYVLDYFSRRGVQISVGSSCKITDLNLQLGIRPQFERFVLFLVRSLERDELLDIVDGTVTFTAPLLDSSQELADHIRQQYPEFLGTVRFLEHCTSHYDAALSGECPSISVLYPDGTSTLMDECAADVPNYAADSVYLGVLAEFLSRVVAESEGRTIRILEVGGGEGSLTAELIDLLAEHPVEYRFTDLGQNFVRRAEMRAAEAGITSMTFGQLDISGDVSTQGCDAESYDLVLGYNVVHATRDLQESVSNLKSLLAPGGTLCLVEATRLRRWDEMAWGLTEGWWQFDDTNVRTESPLISLDQWEHVLSGSGFAEVLSFPQDKDRRESTDIGLILAQKPMAQDRPAERLPRDQRTLSAITKLREIKELGSEVLVLTADVSDQPAMTRVLEQTQERFSKLHGVIHTAGVLGQGLIHHKSNAEAGRVLAPKVQGTAILAQLVADRFPNVDFFAICSALSALRPIIGQADYCAANAYEDAFAASALGQRLGAVSINWGFWQELGMIEQATIPRASKQFVLDEIEREGWSQEGIRAFERILENGNVPQLVVSPDDPSDDAAAEEGNAATGTVQRSAVNDTDQRHSGLPHHLFRSQSVSQSGITKFSSRLSVADHWILDEHRPAGRAVLPGTVYLELAAAAAGPAAGNRVVELRDVYFLGPLVVDDDQSVEVRTVLEPGTDRSRFSFVIISRDREDSDLWLTHARGEIALLDQHEPPVHSLAEFEDRCDAERLDFSADDADIGDSEFATQVAHLTPHWSCFRESRFGDQKGMSRLALNDDCRDDVDAWHLHPALLDMATGFPAMHQNVAQRLPFSYQRVRIYRSLPTEIVSFARSGHSSMPDTVSFDVSIVDSEGRAVVEAEGVTFRVVETDSHTFRQVVDSDFAADARTEENAVLQLKTHGSPESLEFVSCPRRAPRDGEAEVEVHAAGLNFIEVLFALGMLPETDDETRLGMECAGTVVRVGPGVRHVVPGDPVVVYSAGSFSRYLTTSADSMRPRPAHLSSAEATTIPAAFLTAWYSLVERGGLKAGERVLIHAAAGGVGLAAVHIAKLIGADIFATAGSPEKRDYLRSLGISCVMDSRSLAFVDEIRQDTGGEGVDVVLNSLSGEFIPAGLSVLRRYGRFLELGKRDMLANTALGLQPFANSLSFIGIDFGTDLPDFNRVFDRVMESFERGDLSPLPQTEFPINSGAEAFQYMARAKHIGKVVLRVSDDREPIDNIAHDRMAGQPLHMIPGLPEYQEYRARSTSESVATSEANNDSESAAQRLAAATYPRPDLRTEFREPETEAQTTIATAWESLLGVAPVGIDDNFFELKGDSLLAAQLMSRLHDLFGVKLPLGLIFESPTVAELAERLDAVRGSADQLQFATAGTATDEEEEGEI